MPLRDLYGIERDGADGPEWLDVTAPDEWTKVRRYAFWMAKAQAERLSALRPGTRVVPRRPEQRGAELCGS